MKIDNSLIETNIFDEEDIRENFREYEYENPLEIYSNNPGKLAKFLKALSYNHIWYHHYTNFESLKKILKYKTFKMTKGVSKKLNDMHEPEEKGDKDIWESTYITCFNYSGEDKNNHSFEDIIKRRKEENMAMWLLYGKPKTDAVRITISNQTFMGLLQSNCKLKDNGDNIPKDKIEILSSDVFYAKCNDSDLNIEQDFDFQYHNNKKIKFNINGKLFYFLKNKEFTGCVKNYAWHYEDEVRLIARVDKEFDLIKQKECIYLSIPDDLLNTFIITTGPNFTKFRELEELLKSCPGISYSKSLLHGNVNFNDDYDEIGRTIVDLATKIKKLTSTKE